MKKYLLFFLILFLILSCNIKNKEYTSTLCFDPVNSTIDKPFFQDSIKTTYYANDSIVIKNYYKNSYYESLYFNSNDSFFEKRFVSNLLANFFGIDTIFTFSTKDTTFIYKSKRDDFIVTLIDLSLFDSKYNIAKEGNSYKTIKQSLIDTTYKEIFFYDEHYRIYKYINTWKGDRCIYVKK